MELKMGRAPWVVLSSPSAVHEAFVLKGDAFSGRPMVPSMSISSGGGQGFAQPTLTPELASLRRLAFASLFDTAQVARAQLELEDEAARLAEHLLALTASGGAAELRPALRHCVTNCVLRYTFSARVPFSSEGEGEAASSTPHSPHSPQYAELVEVVGEIWRADGDRHHDDRPSGAAWTGDRRRVRTAAHARGSEGRAAKRARGCPPP